MTKEQENKIFKLLVEDRNDYVIGCNRRIAEENGKISGADYMLQRFLDVLRGLSADKGKIRVTEINAGCSGAETGRDCK